MVLLWKWRKRERRSKIFQILKVLFTFCWLHQSWTQESNLSKGQFSSKKTVKSFTCYNQSWTMKFQSNLTLSELKFTNANSLNKLVMTWRSLISQTWTWKATSHQEWWTWLYPRCLQKELKKSLMLWKSLEFIHMILNTN